MDIIQTVKAGTLESGDILITISPHDSELIIELETPVESLYGEKIKQEILDFLSSLEITKGVIKAIDKGALEYTVLARMETAINRACLEEFE
ncbi:MAG: citrate lyase acyl carrier protein [Candidatus Heimdallarchaeota archaeon]|nr:citrate lyase acyl carrier protein [Candidatus Heimdallarchaeota archaeon]MCK5048249.1 citrate lyase acyl carrier protein [Candidatus Heimdallarchaeota archaeon]